MLFSHKVNEELTLLSRKLSSDVKDNVRKAVYKIQFTGASLLKAGVLPELVPTFIQEYKAMYKSRALHEFVLKATGVRSVVSYTRESDIRPHKYTYAVVKPTAIYFNLGERREGVVKRFSALLLKALSKRVVDAGVEKAPMYAAYEDTSLVLKGRNLQGMMVKTDPRRGITTYRLDAPVYESIQPDPLPETLARQAMSVLLRSQSETYTKAVKQRVLDAFKGKRSGSLNVDNPVQSFSIKERDTVVAPKEVDVSYPAEAREEIEAAYAFSLIDHINKYLHEALEASMHSKSDPTDKDYLRYVSGRFAKSVEASIALANFESGEIYIGYDYMTYPYATFAKGGKQYASGRDVENKYISEAIRVIASTVIKARFNIVPNWR